MTMQMRNHTVSSLFAEVDAEFAQRHTGAATWPDPREGAAPARGSFSRCSDPGRFAIGVARARAWVAVLERTGIAAVSERAGALVLVPWASGALPLTLDFDARHGIEENLVAISAGGALVERVPACFCDACDQGSEPVIAAVDEAILTVLNGGVLQVRGSLGRVVTAHLDGWRTEGRFADGELEHWLAAAFRGEAGDDVTAGEPWL